MVSIVFGFASVALGIWGLWIWRSEFLFCLRGILPICLALAGGVAVLMGTAGIKAKDEKK